MLFARSMRCSLIAVLPAALVAASLISAAYAGAVSSIYTSTALKDCRGKSSIDSDNAVRICAGPYGLKVLMREGDLRETVSVGRSVSAAAAARAASQGFGPFNSTTDTIEWRLLNGKPFAAIQRWHIADIDDPGKDHRPRTKQLLVVTKVMSAGVCHVAYIDVTANQEANTTAREAADRLARDFDCAKDEATIAGAPGRATALASPR